MSGKLPSEHLGASGMPGTLSSKYPSMSGLALPKDLGMLGNETRTRCLPYPDHLLYFRDPHEISTTPTSELVSDCGRVTVRLDASRTRVLCAISAGCRHG